MLAQVEGDDVPSPAGVRLSIFVIFRRSNMKRTVVLTMLVMVGGLSIGLASFQQQQKLAPVRKIEKLRDNLFFISGGELADRPTWTGGNTLVFVTDKGVVVVDT